MSVAIPATESETFVPSRASVLNDFTGQHPLVLPGYTWDQYLSLDELFQDTAVRVRFLDNCIEIMPPIGETHESRKIHISRLLETWLLDNDIEFFGIGSTTQTVINEAGGEPDESYFLHEKKTFPDLVIEIALTSGGLSKRAFYAKFPVPELWIWRNDQLEVHAFNSVTAQYDQVEDSKLIPDIDLQVLAECAVMESTSGAIREFRQRIS